MGGAQPMAVAQADVTEEVEAVAVRASMRETPGHATDEITIDRMAIEPNVTADTAHATRVIEAGRSIIASRCDRTGH
jgi:hypothetical protein